MTPEDIQTLVKTLKPLADRMAEYRITFVNPDLWPDNTTREMFRNHITGNMIRELIQFAEKTIVEEKQGE